MSERPYIQFYLGDYIKDTRVLPLNVKGGWVDLILAMWNNNPKGEVSGTIEDYSRIMNCSKDEAILVIQTLKQKKIFDYEELPDDLLRIVSRKQKKMEKLSEIRKTVGKTGGNPNLVNQKDNLNAEYEIEYIIERINKISNEQIDPELKKFIVMLVLRMIEVFKNKNKSYPLDKELDYAACLEIAYKIAEFKKWRKYDVVNGKMDDCIKSWETIVDFISKDDWLQTRSLTDLSTSKEWQRLIMKMKKPEKKKDEPGLAPPLTTLK